MKIFKIMTIFFCASLILSCSNEENTESNDVNKAEFFDELKAFNSNYQVNVIDKQSKSFASKSDDCGFWCTVGKVAVVASADIVGAGAGAAAVQKIAVGAGAATGGTGYAVVTGAAAVITGAGVSVVAADKVNSQKKKSVTNNFGKKEIYANLNIEYPSNFIHLKEIGILHNQHIYNHYNGYKRKSNSKDDEILNSAEFKNINLDIQESIEQYINSDFNMNLLTSDLLNKGHIDSDMSEIYTIFFDIYNNIENSQNIEDIVNFYINAIASTTELNNEVKESLIASFSVASESPKFWLNQK